MKLQEGNVFTGICLSTGIPRQRPLDSDPLGQRNPGERHPVRNPPPERDPPFTAHLMVATAVGSSHPTGMHSCSQCISFRIIL